MKYKSNDYKLSDVDYYLTEDTYYTDRKEK